jgi:general secretion pathway protein A
MYERFFNLRERPFDLTPNPRFLVMTDGHREALSNPEYAIASRKGITLLLGEAGCGKTTIIRTAIERQPARVHCVHVTNPALTRNEFVEILAAQLGLSAPARHSKASLLLEFERLLTRRRDAGETTVLVIDEAQSLPSELLEEIRLLANLETADDKLVSLILAGQPELSEQLNQEHLRQFKQRVALRCELRPLSEAETLAYLAGRIRAAGGVASRIFTREAAALLHQYSGGIPRLINVLADNALLAAFGKQKPQVTSTVIAEIAADFHLPRHVPRPPADTATPQAAARDVEADVATGTLLAVEPAEPAEAMTSELPEPQDRSASTALFGSFSTRRRFPFLGRRGTA